MRFFQDNTTTSVISLKKGKSPYYVSLSCLIFIIDLKDFDYMKGGVFE
jgi:hypothetical protein